MSSRQGGLKVRAFIFQGGKSKMSSSLKSLYMDMCDHLSLFPHFIVKNLENKLTYCRCIGLLHAPLLPPFESCSDPCGLVWVASNNTHSTGALFCPVVSSALHMVDGFVPRHSHLELSFPQRPGLTDLVYSFALPEGGQTSRRCVGH